ncbi:MAG: glycerol-3-phosphate 1-O-acyltransferase PlsY [Deltaproteobacteria bacterium]|nr:glycerol-3-phosphate 1-O-acyltransferase PlsY [Deltaproteobacteria bacterium]
MPLYLILFAIASYLIGSIPTGVVLAKAFARQDIRQAGSGNIGATNVTRILGKKLGALTFLGDMLKGFLPLFIGARLFPDPSQLPVAVFGMAAFLGHVFPVYLRFRGGKGVATAFGIFLYISPVIILLMLGLFVFVVSVSRFVSVGSLSAAAVLPVMLLRYSFPLPIIVFGFCVALLIFVKHKANIQRLLQGTENKIGGKK